jgi:hypothetical protein
MRRADLGVLFVHGIGDQLQGQTLVRFADPLSRWFSRWLSQDETIEAEVGGTPPVGRVSLTASALAPGGGEPANSLLMINPAANEGMGDQSAWLLAESWWAETFRPPKTSALLLWLLLILPYMLLEQFNVPLRRSMRMSRPGLDGCFFTWIRRIGFFVLFIVALPVAALGAIPIGVLLVSMLIPIPQIRALAKAGAIKLANTLGDSFVLVSSTVQYDAMVRQVVRDLQWLSGRTGKVAIVAHSQGAAIAYEALTRYGCPNEVRLFVTVGQGLGKLMRMRTIKKFGSTARFNIAWAGLVGFFLLAIAVPQLAFVAWKDPTHQTALWVVTGIGGFLVLSILAAYLLFWRKQFSGDPDLFHNRRGEVVPWIDYFASADPVPNGPLFSNVQPDLKNVIREIEVWNRASVLTDHTSYVQSEDDFLSCLAQHLCALQDGYALPDTSKELLERARWRGWWRVWWLTFARVFCLVAGLATLVQLWSHLTTIGMNVITKTPDPIATLVGWLTKPLRAFIIVGSPSNNILVGGATVASVLLAGYLILSIIWRFWEARDIQRFFRRQPALARTDPLGGPEFWWFLAAIGLGAAIAVEVCRTRGYASTWEFAVYDWRLSLPLLIALVGAIQVLNRLARRPLRALEDWLMARYPRELVHSEPSGEFGIPELSA